MRADSAPHDAAARDAAPLRATPATPRGALVVGLDAGGTRIRAVLAETEDVDGSALGEGTAGPGNALSVPLPRLTDHLAEALAEAVPSAARGRVAAVAAGFAGASRTAPDEPGRVTAEAALGAALRRVGCAPAVVEVYSDIDVAFAAASGTPEGGLALIAGTGAVAARIAGRQTVATADGDGWLLGDDGSGFWIGRSAVRAALRAMDGRGPHTALIRPVMGAFLFDSQAGMLPDTPEERWSTAQREVCRMRLLPAVMTAPPLGLARLAPLVTEAAAGGDPVAGEILDEAARLLADTVRALDPRPGEVLVATGALLGPRGPLADRLARLLEGAVGLRTEWPADGSRGAAALARLAHEEHTTGDARS